MYTGKLQAFDESTQSIQYIKKVLIAMNRCLRKEIDRSLVGWLVGSFGTRKTDFLSFALYK